MILDYFTEISHRYSESARKQLNETIRNRPHASAPGFAQQIMVPYPPLLAYTMVFLFGLCIGSFLNVCIFRIPLAQSIVHPPSACPGCGTYIRFYDNIPVLSYAFLRGRCRHCRTGISFRYPAVELAAGLTALSVYAAYGPSVQALVYFAFIATLWVVTLIDIDHRIIPDAISLPGIPIFFLASLALPGMTVKESVLGILIGGGSLYAIALAYSVIQKADGMGGGDIKLLAMIGALVGWKGVLFTLFASSALGTVTGIGLMIANGKTMKMAVPFGPFLSAGAVVYIFFGSRLIDWYLSLLPPAV